MNIFVTVAACIPDRPKAPFFLLLMTIGTGNSHMRAAERERTHVVLIKGIGRKCKTLHTMTL
jgi:hypothetical protein